MRKLMLLAAMLTMALVAAAPAIAQVGQENDQDADSGDVDQSFTVTGGGGNGNQCTNISGNANSGNSQNQVGIVQSDESEADDVEMEDRNGDEVLFTLGHRTASTRVTGIYPAFDATPPQYVSAVATDRGRFSPRDLASYHSKEDE